MAEHLGRSILNRPGIDAYSAADASPPPDLIRRRVGFRYATPLSRPIGRSQCARHRGSANRFSRAFGHQLDDPGTRLPRLLQAKTTRRCGPYCWVGQGSRAARWITSDRICGNDADMDASTRVGISYGSIWAKSEPTRRRLRSPLHLITLKKNSERLNYFWPRGRWGNLLNLAWTG